MCKFLIKPKYGYYSSTYILFHINSTNLWLIHIWFETCPKHHICQKKVLKVDLISIICINHNFTSSRNLKRVFCQTYILQLFVTWYQNFIYYQWVLHQTVPLYSNKNAYLIHWSIRHIRYYTLPIFKLPIPFPKLTWVLHKCSHVLINIEI